MFSTFSQKGILLFFVLTVIMAVAILFGYSVNHMSISLVEIILFGILIFLVSFLNKVWALYFMVFFMIFSPEIELAKAASRAVTLRMEDILIIIIMIGWIVHISINRNETVFVSSEINTPILTYSFIIILATILGIQNHYVNITKGIFFTLKFLEYFLLYFIVLNTKLTKKQIFTLIYVHLFTSLSLGLYGIYQVKNGIRVTTPFENTPEPATMGGYIILSLSITFIFFLFKKEIVSKLFFGFLSLILTISLLYTLSRASYIGIAVSYKVILYLSRKRAIIFLILLTGIAIIPLLLPNTVINRINYTFQGSERYGYNVGGVVLEESAAVRIKSYLKVIGLMKISPLFGFGVTGAGFIDGQYFRVLAETGVAGLLAFLWMQFTILKFTYRMIENGKNEFVKLLAMGFFAGHIGLLAHAAGSSTFIIIRIMEPFWFLVAILTQLNMLEEKEKTQEIVEYSHYSKYDFNQL